MRRKHPWPGDRLLLPLMLALLTGTACAVSPKFAAPTGHFADPSTLDLSDVINYRTLTRADFRGSRVPPQFAAHRARLGAATCAHLLTSPDTWISVEVLAASGPDKTYRTRYSRLGFVARMDRNCSWWNPVNPGLPEPYILEHEQIHFALFELQARQLNRRVPELMAGLHATAATPEAAGAESQRKLRKELQRALDEVLARNTRFDEECSMGHQPEAQRRWWALVQAELAATRPTETAAPAQPATPRAPEMPGSEGNPTPL